MHIMSVITLVLQAGGGGGGGGGGGVPTLKMKPCYYTYYLVTITGEKHVSYSLVAWQLRNVSDTTVRAIH